MVPYMRWPDGTLQGESGDIIARISRFSEGLVMIISEPLILHQFPPAFGLPISESPPCAKVEAYLRLTKTPYIVGSGDTRRSPNKMVPYIRWPDGTLQGESGDIIARLEQQAQLNAAL